VKKGRTDAERRAQGEVREKKKKKPKTGRKRKKKRSGVRPERQDQKGNSKEKKNV